jgi:hypothetical protein
MSRLIIGYILIFICISSVSADSQLAISGHVTDSEGAVIAKARVLIHWDTSGSRSGVTKGTIQDVSVLTDGSGVYSAPVPAGFYDVLISAPAFTPIAAKVIVKEGRRAVLNAKLYVDPLVSKEIGGMEVQGVP